MPRQTEFKSETSETISAFNSQHTLKVICYEATG